MKDKVETLTGSLSHSYVVAWEKAQKCLVKKQVITASIFGGMKGSQTGKKITVQKADAGLSYREEVGYKSIGGALN